MCKCWHSVGIHGLAGDCKSLLSPILPVSPTKTDCELPTKTRGQIRWTICRQFMCCFAQQFNSWKTATLCLVTYSHMGFSCKLWMECSMCFVANVWYLECFYWLWDIAPITLTKLPLNLIECARLGPSQPATHSHTITTPCSETSNKQWG